jgi:hypothetical protein
MLTLNYSWRNKLFCVPRSISINNLFYFTLYLLSLYKTKYWRTTNVLYLCVKIQFKIQKIQIRDEYFSAKHSHHGSRNLSGKSSRVCHRSLHVQAGGYHTGHTRRQLSKEGLGVLSCKGLGVKALHGSHGALGQLGGRLEHCSGVASQKGALSSVIAGRFSCSWASLFCI